MEALTVGRPRQRGRPSKEPADEAKVEALASADELLTHDTWEFAQVSAAHDLIGNAMTLMERGDTPAAYRRLCRARGALEEWAKKDQRENRNHRFIALVVARAVGR